MRIFLDKSGPGGMFPCEYHLSRRVRDHNRQCSEGTKPSGDPARSSGLLRRGMEFDLVHPFHRRLFDADARTAVTSVLADAIAKESAKAYRRIDGVLRSLYNDDRYMGPNSLCKYMFLFELELLDRNGADTFHGEIRYRQQTGSFDARSPVFESHELRTDFVAVDCPVCRYNCHVLAFESEKPSLLDGFDCPVCGYDWKYPDVASCRKRFEATIPVVPLAEIVVDPARYHLRKVRTAGTVSTGFEHGRFYDRRLPSGLEIWPRFSASCDEQLSRMPPWDQTGAWPGYDVCIEGIFKYAAVCSTDEGGRSWPRVAEHPGSKGLVLAGTETRRARGFGHMWGSDAELIITRMERLERRD